MNLRPHHWVYLASLVLLIVPGAFAPEATSEIRLTFIYKDGKLIPVVQNDSVAASDSSGFSSKATSAVFLLILVLICLIGNLLLVCTIGTSLVLRKLPLNVHLMGMGIACIFECLMNIIWSVVYVLTQPWEFGEWPCYVNSLFMEFIPLVYTLMLLSVTVDRYQAIRDPMKYKKTLPLNKHRAYTMILLYWIMSLTAVSPLVILPDISDPKLKSWPFPHRYSCQPMDGGTKEYGLITGCLLYLLPWICLIVAMGMKYWIYQAERKKELKALRGREQTNKLAEPSLFMFAMKQNFHFWNEMKSTWIIVALSIAYFILMVPYILLNKVAQSFQETWQKNDYEYYNNLFDAVICSNQNGTNANVTSSSAVENCEERDEKLVPEIRESLLGEDVDTAFVWLRYIHAALMPILVFLIHKDLRKKLEDILSQILCCWRPNSVESKKQPARLLSPYQDQRRAEWEKRQKKFKNVTNHNVPVLFASSEGLYLRLIDDSFGSLNNDDPDKDETEVLDDSIKGQWSVEPKFVMEMCDLQLPMSASRGRTPSTANNSSSENAIDPGFGATVTVIVSKHAPNLKPSLKKPRQSPEVDEGFIDEIEPQPHHRKVVQFRTQIDEIPFLESKSELLASPEKKKLLPPLNHDEVSSPDKKKSRVDQSPSKKSSSSSRKSSKDRSPDKSHSRSSRKHRSRRHERKSSEDQELIEMEEK